MIKSVHDHWHVVTSRGYLPFFSDLFGVLDTSSFLSSFLFGLHTMSVTMPSARFNNEAALKKKRREKKEHEK